MLMQLHYQYPDGRSEFVAQSEFVSGAQTNQEALEKWAAGVQERHALPAGCNWLMVPESSLRFAMAPAEDSACERSQP